jgi:hypothetical protein
MARFGHDVVPLLTVTLRLSTNQRGTQLTEDANRRTVQHRA